MSTTKETIHITVPPRMYQVPGAALVAGTIIGAVRGSRKESLRFLAENVHRAPTTVQGWYFYKKTKNYRMMLAGLREGGRDAVRLGTTAVGWVTIEEGLRSIGFAELSEIGAGIGTGAIFGGVYGMGLRTTGRAMLLGLIIGASVLGLRTSKEKLVASARGINESVEH